MPYSYDEYVCVVQLEGSLVIGFCTEEIECSCRLKVYLN